MKLHRSCAGFLLFLAAATCAAADFKTIGPNPVILYDAPSPKGPRLYVAPSGMPVEVVVSYGEWVRIRDVNGDQAWTEVRNLSNRRAVIVRNPKAVVRATADDNGTVVMTVDKGVTLELVDPQVSGWIQVRHKDGLTGFIRAADVWGI
jgi:SH3-like domain-containing protein